MTPELTPQTIQYAQRVTAARQAWKDLPGHDTTWGLKMKTKIAKYYFVKEGEMDQSARSREPD